MSTTYPDEQVLRKRELMAANPEIMERMEEVIPLTMKIAARVLADLPPLMLAKLAGDIHVISSVTASVLPFVKAALVSPEWAAGLVEKFEWMDDADPEGNDGMPALFECARELMADIPVSIVHAPEVSDGHRD